MINAIKSFNAYNSKKVIRLTYALLPIGIFAVLFVTGLFLKKVDLDQRNIVFVTLAIIAIIEAVVMICLSDRFGIGTILVNNSGISEMMKTSFEGGKVTVNAVIGDAIMKGFLFTFVFVILFFGRLIFCKDSPVMLIFLNLMGIAASHTTCSLICWICRKIESSALASVVHSFGLFLVTPAIVMYALPTKFIHISVLVLLTVLFLLADAAINIIGIRLLKKFIKNEWYTDAKPKGREDED